jgi:hypothetical protein
MKLERITIRAAGPYDKFTGYEGEITFSGVRGDVKIRTGDEMSRRILEVCADELVAASQQVARELTANIIEQVAQSAIETPAE